MKQVFHRTSVFEAFEERIARTITERLGIEPSIDQLAAWEFRGGPDTFLRPDIIDHNFSIELSSTMGRIAMKSLDDPLIEFTGYKKNGWGLKDQRSGLTRTTAVSLRDRGLLMGYQCNINFTSFNYPSTITDQLIWYVPAPFRRTPDGTYEFKNPDTGMPHINRIVTKPRFKFGSQPNVEVLRRSRQNSGALQRQKPKK